MTVEHFAHAIDVETHEWLLAKCVRTVGQIDDLAAKDRDDTNLRYLVGYLDALVAVLEKLYLPPVGGWLAHVRQLKEGDPSNEN